jgi:Tfp pilus assembly protein PilX
MTSFLRQLKSNFRREEGMALVFALVAMMTMSILLVSLVSYTGATARNSYLKRSDQNAYSLAEAALNQAFAQLASHYYDSSNSANNSTTSFSRDWIVGGTTSQQSPTSTAACTSGSTCMSWSLVSCAFYTSITGCTLNGGSGGTTQGTVTLKGTGTVPNPTGGAARTASVTAKIDVSQPPKLVATPSFWTEIYAGTPPSSGCDVTFGQGVAVTAPVYVAGNLCLAQTGQVTGSTTTVKVGGWLSLKNSSFMGTSASHIGSIQVAGFCPNGSSSTNCIINAAGGPVWDNNPSSQHAATAPTPDPLPAVNWSWMQNAQANSVPAASCTNGKSFSDANFDLLPATSYSCTSSIGSITYTAGSPGTLALSGDLYFPNNLTMSAATVKYTGVASIFVGGTFTTSNNAVLCVAIASGNCDFANATNSGSANYWDTTAKVLLIQAQGAIAATNLHFQGALYSATSINLGGGQSQTQGPLVTPGALTVGQQLSGSFPIIPLVQAGSLGTPPPPYALGKPYGGGF